MKTILLAAINARYTHSCLALYCLKSHAGGSGLNIIVREYSINRDPESILADMASVRPDVLGLSVYIWNSGIVRRILREARQRCGCGLLVLGGPEVSYNPEAWLAEFPGVDCIIAGPGEAAFRELLERGARGRVMRVPNPPFCELPAPYSDEDLRALSGRYVYYESSRGCPFRCTYCLSSRGDLPFEAKDTGAVTGELERIIAHRPKLVKFVDRTFNLPTGRHREIWSYLIARHAGGPTAFHFEIHPMHLDDDDFSLLARAPDGLFQLEAGVQSTSREVRAACRRTGDWEAEKAALSRIIGMGTIRVHIDLIAGLPFEDMASAARSFNEVYGLGPGYFQQGTLKILPGTEISERAAEYGMVYAPSAPYRVKQTRWLSGNEMQVIETIAGAVDRFYNTKRFTLTLALLAERFDTAFDLYRALALTDPPPAWTWESGASCILALVAARFPAEEALFRDALLWDWCAGSGTHRIPRAIKPPDSAAVRKKGYAFFSALAQDGIVRYESTEFALADLKRSVFFRGESEEFRTRCMEGRTFALFLPDRRVPLYDA